MDGLNRLRRSVLACVLASTAACSGSSTTPTSQTGSQLPAGSTLEVQPPFILFVNETDRAHATAFVRFQAMDVSSDAQWQSSNPTVATVGDGGQLVARSAGRPN